MTMEGLCDDPTADVLNEPRAKRLLHLDLIFKLIFTRVLSIALVFGISRVNCAIRHNELKLSGRKLTDSMSVRTRPDCGAAADGFDLWCRLVVLILIRPKVVVVKTK